MTETYRYTHLCETTLILLVTFKIRLQVHGHYELVEGSTQNYLIDSFVGDLRLPQR